jgi:hypothetical protein
MTQLIQTCWNAVARTGLCNSCWMSYSLKMRYMWNSCYTYFFSGLLLRNPKTTWLCLFVSEVTNIHLFLLFFHFCINPSVVLWFYEKSKKNWSSAYVDHVLLNPIVIARQQFERQTWKHSHFPFLCLCLVCHGSKSKCHRPTCVL